MKRFPRFSKVSTKKWTNWHWQEQNSLRNGSDIKSFFPNLSAKDMNVFHNYTSEFKLGITPYLLSLIQLDNNGLPLKNDPLWSQFKFFSNQDLSGPACYDKKHENWERPKEMPTPMLHHKYYGRAIIRLVNACFGYCNYCYLTTRIIDKTYSSRKDNSRSVWLKTLKYLELHPDISDVLISGGDPLILSNEKLEQVFRELSKIKSIKTLRLNTRVLTYNPFRFDTDLIKIFKKYRLTTLEIHMSHPAEFTDTVREKLSLFDEFGYRPIIVWRSPLLKGINDNEKTLMQLFNLLYENRIVPYYFFHYAPYALGRLALGVGIRRGAKLLRNIRRKVPGIAFPRYTLFHIDGKQDVPLESGSTPHFIYQAGKNGNPTVKFKNWKNHWVTYNDIRETPCRKQK